MRERAAAVTAGLVLGAVLGAMALMALGSWSPFAP
jgi:hypothetical protein